MLIMGILLYYMLRLVIKKEKMMKLKYLTLFICCFLFSFVFADNIKIFPLGNYDQNIHHWIKPDSSGYDTPILSSSQQASRENEFRQKWFAPWDESYVETVLNGTSPQGNLHDIENFLLNKFNNQNKTTDEIQYGENFRPHTLQWFDDIQNNMNLPQLASLTYQPQNNAIMIDNAFIRVIPTNDVAFFNHELAGQGYPFDNIQVTSIWAGTPIYVMYYSRDKAWAFILSPAIVGWIPANKFAYTSRGFQIFWQQHKQMSVIIHNKTPIINRRGQLLFNAYIGSVFPQLTSQRILVPVKKANNQATFQQVSLDTQQAITQPLSATPHHFADIIDNLHGIPYGWGNMYFYNDCSGLTKNLFAVFGIWLERNSLAQLNAGKTVDVDKIIKTPGDPAERLEYFNQHAHPFMTLLYIGGHIIMYLGQYPHVDSNGSSMWPLTFQSVWGLTNKAKDMRSVIGQAVIFPMLLSYPERPKLISLAAKTYFKMVYLDEPNTMLMQQPLSLKMLTYPPFLLESN